MNLHSTAAAAAVGALVIALAAATLCPAHADAAQARGKLTEELLKQERIYQHRGKDVREGYVIGRSLAEYEDALAPGFDLALAALGAGDRWLDIGAGQGDALLDYLDRGTDDPAVRVEKARVVAISIEDRRTERWHARSFGSGDAMLYLFKRRLREYSTAELGQFRLISDVVGGFSYTDNLSRFVAKVLEFLQPGGRFFTVLQDVSSEAGTNKPYYEGSPHLTEIVAADGSAIKVCAWLKRVSCVEVSCSLKTDWTPPIETYQVRRTCDDVRVPRLVPVHYEAGTPPERRFLLAE